MVLVVVRHDIQHTKSSQGIANQEKHQEQALEDWEVFTHNLKDN